MLSEKISNITRQLRNRAQDGSLTREMFDLALENLDASVAEARQLEAAAVPDAERRQTPGVDPADLASGRVVSLDEVRIERKRFGSIPGGGGAA